MRTAYVLTNRIATQIAIFGSQIGFINVIKNVVAKMQNINFRTEDYFRMDFNQKRHHKMRKAKKQQRFQAIKNSIQHRAPNTKSTK